VVVSDVELQDGASLESLSRFRWTAGGGVLQLRRPRPAPTPTPGAAPWGAFRGSAANRTPTPSAHPTGSGQLPRHSSMLSATVRNHGVWPFRLRGGDCRASAT